MAAVDPDVLISRIFDTPRDRVFEAWTDPDQVAAWYRPEHVDTPRVRARDTGSAASVYRIVDDLLALGPLHRLDGRDGVARYEIAEPEHHHHHFVDEATGSVEAFPTPRSNRPSRVRPPGSASS
jgi:hypothetical protein